jgi:hypothetical protein
MIALIIAVLGGVVIVNAFLLRAFQVLKQMGPTHPLPKKTG